MGGAPFAFVDALLALDGDGREVDAGLDDLLFEQARPAFFAVVEGKGAEHPATIAMDRR